MSLTRDNEETKEVDVCPSTLHNPIQTQTSVETSADDLDSSDFPKLGISMQGILYFIGMMSQNIVVLFNITFPTLISNQL